jgi:hypothetical protein
VLFGNTVTEVVREAIGLLPEWAWTVADKHDGGRRDRAPRNPLSRSTIGCLRGTRPPAVTDLHHEHPRRADRGALIRPDGCVAWALPTGQDLDATSLVRALGTWFGNRPERCSNSRLRFAR